MSDNFLFLQNKKIQILKKKKYFQTKLNIFIFILSK